MDCGASALVKIGKSRALQSSVRVSLAIAMNGDQSAAREPPYCASNVAKP